MLPISAVVVDFTRPTPTEPAPDVPPVEAAIPTTIEVRFCAVSVITRTFSSALTVLYTPALTSFQNTLAPSAIPTDVFDDAASVPVKSVMVVLSLAITSTFCVLAAELSVALSFISAPSFTSA